MSEPLIDLKALLVEHEDCDAGTVQKLRNALAQGGPQFRNLREVSEILSKRIEAGSGNTKKMHLKLGIAYFFLGHMEKAAENLKHGETALAAFYLGRALASRSDYDGALKAFEKAEKLGYTPSTVRLQKVGIYLKQGDHTHVKSILADAKKEGLESHSSEYHFQMAGLHQAEGDRLASVKHLERSVELDPAHTGALFQLGYLNDLAGNDDEAISFYERCLKHAPVHAGAVNNLGVLYEDSQRYDKAVECYSRLLRANPNDERARLFYKDAEASLAPQEYVEGEGVSIPSGPSMDKLVTDFELSVRARNCLKRLGIRTLGDLTRVSRADLLGSKNFGETSLEEIDQLMRSNGMQVGQSIQEGIAAPHGGKRHAPHHHHMQFSPEEQALMSRPVGELSLSVRARKCMNRLGINTIGELVSRTADDLLESKNFGMTSLTEVREKLSIMNLRLRGD